LDRAIALMIDGAIGGHFPGVAAMARGGKRLRAVMTLATARAVAPDRAVTDETVDAAAAIEAIHLATLLHDDVIDEADERRGVETLHRRYGRTGAILAGDMLFAATFRRLIDFASPPVQRLLLDAVARMAEGETEQTLAALAGREIILSEYFEIISKKTAAFFGVALEIGAVASGAAPEVRDALRRFGLEFGLVFQIVDDILDWSADPEELGKALHADIRCGKLTLPLFLFLEDDPVVARGLIACAADGAIQPLAEELARRGYLRRSWRMAERRADAAREALRDAGGDTKLFEEILDYSLSRRR
jgi:octaprenyl-diphosphate synthase